ncbi:hypothetical protein CHCC20335_1503 [Bacillus paralicheniformis]|nr:hypothetical protein CHCC20335_1503 [Bacillus paralicheniformis]
MLLSHFSSLLLENSLPRFSPSIRIPRQLFQKTGVSPQKNC